MSQPESSPEDNATAWRQLRATVEELPGSKDPAPWRGMVLAFLADLEGFGLPALLRVERVGDRLVFSLPEAENPTDTPRVALSFLPEDQTVKVAYYRGDSEVKAPLIEAWVSAPAAVQVTFGALRRLWTETRPALPMPEELQRA